MRRLQVVKYLNVADRAGKLGAGMSGEVALERSTHSELEYTLTGPNSCTVWFLPLCCI